MNAIEELIRTIAKLPGIGRKSAARAAYFLLNTSPGYLTELSSQIANIQQRIRPCKICGNYTDSPECGICSDPGRDRSVLCVTEQPRDIATIEHTREYNGLFHAIMGVLNPIEGIGPEQLNIGSLLTRIRENDIKEVIIATNPTVEGDTTALYLLKILKDHDLNITRLASGIPVGGDLEYSDSVTLAKSLRGRIKLTDEF